MLKMRNRTVYIQKVIPIVKLPSILSMFVNSTFEEENIGFDKDIYLQRMVGKC